jgi:hypothetical protein
MCAVQDVIFPKLYLTIIVKFYILTAVVVWLKCFLEHTVSIFRVQVTSALKMEAAFFPET